MSIVGLLGRKIGMTTYYHQDGRAEPVTALEVGPCVVTQVKTAPRDGYEAVQIGFMTSQKLNKPVTGHLARSGGKFRHLQEFSVSDLGEFEVGQEIKADVFEPGDTVKVVGESKGRGFAGGVRRHNFRGGPKTHGQSDRHRAPGSIGAGSSPGRVWPGTRMAGHYGAAQISVRGLKIVHADLERNLVLVKGAVPGPRNGIIRIEKQNGA
ncbi:MAG: 50S ribosomal protein L3 [Dehalococcoidia bacterium]